jgi:hypothetical protein
MASLLTKKYRIFLAQQFQAAFANANNGIYVFCGRPQAWTDASNVAVSDTNPPVAAGTTQNVEYEYWRDLLGIKKVNSANTAYVIPRRNWTANTVYTQYDDTDSNLFTKNFYVLDTSVSPFRVYKCLWNNKGASSATAPSVIGANPNPTTTADGYVWQYMYAINTSDFVFLTNSWMPVLTDSTVQTNANTNSGKIPVAVPLIVVDGGTGYNAAATTTTTIIGDGTGATVTANGVTIVGAAVTNVVLATGGLGYSRVDTINVYQAGVGTQATCRALLPPFPNHGYDPAAELGTAALMLSIQFSFDESGKLTVANDYRRIGVIVNPLDANGAVCNASFYRQTFDCTISSNTGILNPDDLVFNQTKGTAPGATVVDVVRNVANTAWVVRLTGVNDKGEATPFQTGEVLKCNTSGVQATISSVSNPELSFFSGEILYVDQRIPTARANDQVEDIKVVFQLG